MRRGDIRRAILSALKDSPAHGYEVMRRLEEMSGGLWRPSPGSVYPHLQMLEDEGMVQSVETDGTRTFTLTEAGGAEATADTPLPWETGAENDDQIRTLRLTVVQIDGCRQTALRSRGERPGRAGHRGHQEGSPGAVPNTGRGLIGIERYCADRHHDDDDRLSFARCHGAGIDPDHHRDNRSDQDLCRYGFPRLTS